METLIQMILPAAVLPAILSLLALWLNQQKAIAPWIIALIWLPSCVWLVGMPALIPEEASHWLVPLVIFSVLIAVLLKSQVKQQVLLQIILLLLILVAVVWPVLSYQFSWMLVAELLAVILAASALYLLSATNQKALPALTMMISSGGMGLVVALGGSLLIGQLAGALASVLFAFVLFELVSRLNKSAVTVIELVPVMQLYFVILVIARVFAEIEMVPSLMLLLAPLASVVINKRYAFVASALCIGIAVLWLLMTTDSSGYY